MSSKESKSSPTSCDATSTDADDDKAPSSKSNNKTLSSQNDDETPSSQNIVLEFSASQWKGLLFCCTLFVLVAAVGVGFWLQDETTTHWTASPKIFRQIGPGALALFRQHDVNDDGALDVREFEPLAHIILDVNVSLTYDLPVERSDNVVTVKALFQPLNRSTMQMMAEGEDSVLKSDLASLHGLQNWKTPAIEMKNFAARHFTVFMPKVDETKLGSAYFITPFGGHLELEEYEYSRSPSSNRFYPPRVTGDLVSLHNLLAMLHPKPFINSRFEPQGSMACVRAYNDEWLDISIRVHAEFQLEEPPYQPFWFTPAQFKGRLIMSRDLKRIKYFRMYVPSNRRLNVDMEWLKNDPEQSMIVDIGYMSEMSLVATSESRPAQWDGYDLRTSLKPLTTAPEEALEGLTWTREVQVDVCEKAMEVVFYPFKTVEYYNFTEAFDVATKENKLVHSIALWGALDDQSC